MGSEMCIRDRKYTEHDQPTTTTEDLTMSEYLTTMANGTTYEGCNDCRGLRRLIRGRKPRTMKPCTCDPRWVLFTKRTEDPKLAWIERELAARGIPSRRNGSSFHAPILEVHEADHERADALLQERLPRRRRTIDDMPDDHASFYDGGL